MKIYAYQVAPEYQKSPLYTEDIPENVYIFGNKRFTGRGADDIKNIINSMYDAADELKALMRARSYYNSFIEIIADMLPAPTHKNEYTRAERLQWRALLLHFDAGAVTENDAITKALELITGREYAAAQICGCCQGDWNNIIYPSEYGPEWLKDFEIEYFNMGDEWRIHEDSPDSNYMYYFYTHAWNEDGQRAEIAIAAGVDPADVVLYVFDGYERNAIYKEVRAC